MTRQLISFDWAIKKILRSKANFGILEGFLSEKQKSLYSAKKIADIYPEYYLIEIRNFDDIAKDTLDEWIYFLKNEQIEDSFTAKGLQQAQETLDVLKMNEPERLAYEQHQKQLHHEASLYESTYVLGKLEGKKEAVLVTARNMKQMGMALEIIAQATGLDIQEVERL